MKSMHLLKEYVSSILKEEEGRLTQDQIKITCHLVMDPDAHVPDTMTRIRALASVTVVGQQSPVDRTGKGNTLLDVYVKFLPASEGLYKNLMTIGKLIKSLPGVRIVRVVSVGGRPVRYKDENIVI